jgi:plastocyanin
VTYNATGTPGSAAAIAKVSGDNQADLVNAAFALPLQVRVQDQFGNPILGATVNWSPSGSISLTTLTSVTDAQGIATKPFQATAVSGVGQVVASVGGVAATVTFNAIVAAVQVTAGNNFFRSVRNLSQDPAVDTIATNQAILWVAVSGGHTVHSNGAPVFANSGALSRYAVVFPTAGTYQYDCANHPDPDMTGRVVVQ